MERYYFNFTSKTDRIDDPRGVELDGIRSAHMHALRLIRSTTESIAGELWREWTIDIADESRRSILTVLFRSDVPERGTFGTSANRGRSGNSGWRSESIRRKGYEENVE